MDRIVIIGSPGAGKSTLARKLGRKLQIPVVHLDRKFWLPGWVEKPRNTRVEILEKIVRKKQWIIEGTYLGSSEPRLKAADTIIFLDTSAPVCLKRIVMRYMSGGRSLHERPEGCYDKLSLIRILKVLVFPIRGRIMLNKKLKSYGSKKIIRLHSVKEVEDFFAQLEAQTNEKNNPAKIPSIPRSRQLALARR